VAFNTFSENFSVFRCRAALTFNVRCFETSPSLRDFNQNIKSCTGSRLYKRELPSTVVLWRTVLDKICFCWIKTCKRTADMLTLSQRFKTVIVSAIIGTRYLKDVAFGWVNIWYIRRCHCIQTDTKICRIIHSKT